MPDRSADGENRRGFFGQAAAIVCGGVALLVPAAAGVAAFLNPLRQKGQGGEFLRLASLDVLPADGTPQKVPVIADRTDAWNRFPAEPIGAVFLRRSGRQGDGAASGLSARRLLDQLRGSPQGGKFFCPATRPASTWPASGPTPTSPSPRDMDTLEVEIRNKNEVWVKFQNVRASAQRKEEESPVQRRRGNSMMKLSGSWFNDRTGFGDWCGRLAESPVPGGACWCKVLPCTIVFAFCVQAITGFFLWAYYSPSAQTAWESVYFLQYEVAGGWLLRAIHHYSAHVLLAMLILYVVQSILTGAYRAPRELVFWATVGLGLCALAAVLTGDLLSWDQNGYAATKTRTGFLTFLPLGGRQPAEDRHRRAGAGAGPPDAHPLLRPARRPVCRRRSCCCWSIRGVLARRANAVDSCRQRQHRPCPTGPPQAWRVRRGLSGWCWRWFWLLACQHGVTPPDAGVPLLSPADTDPANAYNAARPEWFLVGVYEFSHLFSGQWAIMPIFIVPGLCCASCWRCRFWPNARSGSSSTWSFTLALLVGRGRP